MLWICIIVCRGRREPRTRRRPGTVCMGAFLLPTFMMLSISATGTNVSGRLRRITETLE